MILFQSLNTRDTPKKIISFFHYFSLIFVCSLAPIYADDISHDTLYTELQPVKNSLPENTQQTGQTSQKTIIKSITALKKAAENGFAAAQHALAIHYLTNNNPEIKKAVFWLEKAVEQNNLDALRDLAYLYYLGQGVKKDLQQAKILLKKPIQQGNVFALQLFNRIEQETVASDDKYFHNAQNWYRITNQPNLIKKSRSAKELVNTSDFILTTAYAWKQAWQDQDIKQYLSFYSKNFKYHKGDYNHWAKYRRRIFNTATNIQLTITNIRIRKEVAQKVVSFNQYYQSDSYSDKVYKELFWQQETDSKWRIIAEKTIVK